MKKIGIFYGSDTGNTENIANIIHKKIGFNISDIYDISNSNKNNLEIYNNLILGIPTWYYGEAQCDWENFFPKLKNINFSNKTVAIFGCGDQEDYSEYFCDAMGLIYNIIKPLKAKLIGSWSTKNYYFEKSKGLLNNNYFVGLAIDEDRQPELTDERINNWIKKIKKKMNLK